MKTFLSETFTSLRATLVFAVLLCGIFPLIILGAGQLLFPRQANGSLIESKDRRIIGSECSDRISPTRNISTPGPPPPAPMDTTPLAPAAPTSDRLPKS